MFLIRSAEPRDLTQVLTLARLLDSYNLPYDRRYIAGLLACSRRSFQGRFRRWRDGKYLFVMEETSTKRLVGCSLIIAQHGQPGLPHVYFQVTRQSLRLGWTTSGPTEIGGLVVKPASRRRPEHLGRQLSYIRFTYMAMHPARFRREVLVEYLATPPGEEPALWVCLGRALTGLSYHQAERLSVHQKDFILSSFPKEKIDYDLLSAEAQAQLGAVSPTSAPACGLLERIGFRRTSHIDVFDGGPSYMAPLRRIALVRRTKRLAARQAVSRQLPTLALVATERQGKFRAAQTACRMVGGRVELPVEALRALRWDAGDEVAVTPLP